MSNVAKVSDYPHLRKVGGGVINVDQDAYNLARAQVKAAGRMKTLEDNVGSMSKKLDEIFGLLSHYAESRGVI